MEKKVTYRLAIDGGIASLGWALYKVDSSAKLINIIDGNVSLFPTAIGAEDRRQKRGARRNIDREQQRLDLICALFQSKMKGYERNNAPKEILNTSPFRLRANALDREMNAAELQRICLHMAKHRGSSAVRISENEEDAKEGAAVETAYKRTLQEMTDRGARTYGELLWRIEKANNKAGSNNSRKIRINKEGNKASDAYSHYPLRFMIHNEFDLIIDKQATYNPKLTEQFVKELREILFFERESTTPLPGNCIFVEGDKRLPKLSRLFQLKRIYEEVSNLRIDTGLTLRILTFDERDFLIENLMEGGALGKKAIKKILKIKGSDKIYLGAKKDLSIKPYPFDYLLGSDDVLGERWQKMGQARQDMLLDILATIWDEAKAHDKIKGMLGCTDNVARAVLKTPLPSGYGNLGPQATLEILEILEGNIISVTEAALMAGFKERTAYEGELLARLPYYGEILRNHVIKVENAGNSLPYQEKVHGRIPNMVVHRTLIQLRKLVNDIIKKYGVLAEIHLELGRELSMSVEEREEAVKQIEKNRKANEKIRKELIENDVKPKRSNINLYKLWQRQDKKCAYTLTPINLNDLFGASIHVDHILPWSVTFDDGLANKVVCTATSNLHKGNDTPYDAFQNREGYDWAAILRHVDKNVPSQKWRFTDTALAKFEADNKDNFSARANNDNRYVAKMMRFYLSCICPSKNIVVTNGRVTRNLNGAWGLDKLFIENSPIIQEQIAAERGKSKRADHRHHFIDAVAIGGVTRAMIQKIQTLSAKTEKEGNEHHFFDKVFREIDPPFGNKNEFSKRVLALLSQIRPVVKSNHKKQGQLHLETRNGIIDGPDDEGFYINRVRKKIADIKDLKALHAIKIEATIPDLVEVIKAREKIDTVKNGILSQWDIARPELEAVNEKQTANGRKPKEIDDNQIFKKARDLYFNEGGAREYTLYKRERLIVPPHAISGNKARFGYVGGNNLRVDFFVNRETSVVGWQCVSLYDALREAHKHDPFIPDQEKTENEKLFSLFKDDLVEMAHPEDDTRRDTFKVAKFSNGKLTMIPILDARMSIDGRKNYGDKGLKFYRDAGVRKIKQNGVGDIVWKSMRLS